MEDKALIPVPPAQRWREFRIQLLPLVVFVIITLAVVTLWRQVVVPINLVGEVATAQYQVRSLLEGTLTDLKVEEFSYVSKGDEIGHVTVMDPANIQAEIDVMRTELSLLQLRTGANVDQARVRMEQLKLEQGHIKAQLDTARSELEEKNAVFELQTKLLAGGLSTQEAYEVAKFALQTSRITIDGLVQELANYEKAIHELSNTVPESGGQAEVVSQALQAQQKQLELTSRPVVLKAPADGVIGKILFHPGEKVRAGEPIATISSTNSTHIIGYLRQPLVYVPQVDDEVHVRSRSAKRVIGSAKVIKVGGQLDFMDPAIINPDNVRKEKALAIMVSLPAGLMLRPGEFVDLWVARK